MPQGSLARRYAKAFLDITVKKQIVDRTAEDLVAFADAVGASRDLQIALENPAINAAQRLELLRGVLQRLGAREETRRLVEVLLERNRIGAIGEIAIAYRDEADRLAGRVRAEVISAERLDEERLGRIRAALEQVTGRSVLVQVREDPALIAGVVTKIGSWVYDGSLRTQMQQLRETLLAG